MVFVDHQAEMNTVFVLNVQIRSFQAHCKGVGLNGLLKSLLAITSLFLRSLYVETVKKKAKSIVTSYIQIVYSFRLSQLVKQLPEQKAASNAYLLKLALLQAIDDWRFHFRFVHLFKLFLSLYFFFHVRVSRVLFQK